MNADLFSPSRTRRTETLTNAEYIPRVRELEAQGALYFRIKVLNHNAGYTIQCDIPTLDNNPSM